MKILKTDFKGLYLINPFYITDSRGTFVKFYNESDLDSNNKNFKVKEVFFSVSKKNTIRGMHFQSYPHQQKKIVFPISGKCLDVIIDLRPKSKTFKKNVFFHLDSENPKGLLIPEGFAHGFKALSDNTILAYLSDEEFKQDHDSGIRFDSFNFDWGNHQSPIVSIKDRNLQTLDDYIKKLGNNN